MQFLKTSDGREYRIKSNGKWVERRQPNNYQPDWSDFATVPTNRSRILDLRESRMGGNMECQLDDGLWYTSIGGGIVQLTDEEKRKKRSSSSSGESISSHSASSSSSDIDKKIVGATASMLGTVDSWLDRREAASLNREAEKIDAQLAEQRAARERKAARERRREVDRALDSVLKGKVLYQDKIYEIILWSIRNDFYFTEDKRRQFERRFGLTNKNAEYNNWVDNFLSECCSKENQSYTTKAAKRYQQDFLTKFPVPFLDPVEEVTRRNNIRKKAREEADKKDAADKEAWRGRWDYTQIKQTKGKALMLAIFLGWCGAPFLYMKKKLWGYLLLALGIASIFSLDFPLLLLVWLVSIIWVARLSGKKFKQSFLPLAPMKYPTDEELGISGPDPQVNVDDDDDEEDDDDDDD